MDYYFTQEEVDYLAGYADGIQRIIGRAIGREEAVRLRREQICEDNDFCAALARRKALAGEQQAETVFLEFTSKELSKMPKFFQKIYKLKGGKAAHIRQKENGTYEIRYRRDGINLSVSSKNLGDAKERLFKLFAPLKRKQ